TPKSSICGWLPTSTRPRSSWWAMRPRDTSRWTLASRPLPRTAPSATRRSPAATRWRRRGRWVGRPTRQLTGPRGPQKPPQSAPERRSATRKMASAADAVAQAEGPMMCLANVVYTPTPPTEPDPPYVGSDDFTFTVNYGAGSLSAPATVNLWVDANSPPVAQD